MNTENINVMSFSERRDLMKKRLLIFLAELEQNYKAKGMKDLNIMGLTIEYKIIRKYKKVTPGNPSMSFVLGTSQAQDTAETYLNTSDAFMPIGMAFGFSKVPISPNVEEISNQEIYNAPDKTVFGDQTTPTAPIEWKALLSYYWGTWAMTVNSKVVFSELHAEGLLKVPQVQETSGGLMAYNQIARFEPLFTNPLLDGNKKTELTFTPAPGANTANAGGKDNSENYAVLEVAGFVVKDLSSALNALNAPFYFL
jgi:hypothetical protein